MKIKKLIQPLVKTDPDEKWYENTFNEKLRANEEIPSDFVAEYEAKARELFDRDCQISAAAQQKSQANVSWISQIIKSGTSSDKMSAIQLNTQLDPIHSLQNVRFLISWLQKKVLREVIPVLCALKDVFVDELLPPNRKLVLFKNRPLNKLESLTKGNQTLIDKRLIMWKYESELKKSYEEFIHAVEGVCKSPVDAVVIYGCKVLKELLSKRPEQEQLLLSFLTNKLCHNKKIVGAKVADHLFDLVEDHPNMRLIVATEVEKVMFRKNVPLKAQLYAVHFLSRIVFNANDADLAMKLLQIYFSLFKIMVQSEEENNKILPIVMNGAHRAVPYAKERIKELMSEIDSLYKIVHLEKFSIALAALKVLFKILTFNQELSDRFYASFYRRLLTVKSSNHDAELFSLLEKVIIADEINGRVKAFLKRILQIALSSTPAFAGAALLLYNRVVQNKGNNLVKLIIEKPKKLKGKKKKFLTDDSDDEEFYVDVDKMEEDQKPNDLPKLKNGKVLNKNETGMGLIEKKPTTNGLPNGISQKGWVHRAEKPTKKPGSGATGYDYEARNPLFANADQSVDSELYQLSQHFHPSIAIFAQTIMDGKIIDYKGDPLEDYSLVRFLDRFAFKNPKSKKERQSIFSRNYEVQGVKAIGVKSNDYLNKKIEEIPIDERYLHRFASKKLKQEKDEEFDEIASVNSDEFDMIMDRFEPGEANEEFDVDFGGLFGPEKTKADKKIKMKRRHDSEDDLDSDAPDEEGDLLQDLPDSDDEDDKSDDDVEDDAFLYSDDGEDDDLLGEEEVLDETEDEEKDDLDEDEE